MTQFSLFGAAAARPDLADLHGVLLAGGHVLHRGAASRLSIVVADRWRADALAEEFAQRGLADAEPVVAAEGGFSVRTDVSAVPLPVAMAWTRGARQEPPADLALTASGLRLWTIASGRPEGIADAAAYHLGTAEPDDATHRAAGAQLSRLGIAAVSVSARADPGWRVTSAKRLRRLVELVGPAPEGGSRDWPAVR